MKRWLLLPLLIAGCVLPGPSRDARPIEVGWHERLGSGLNALDRDLVAYEEALAALDPAAPPTEVLALLAARDARVEQAWDALLDVVPRHARSYAERPLVQRLYAVRVANTVELERLLAEVGWFTRGEFGPQADRRAWTVVQHADHDPGLQREVLTVLEGLAEVGQTDPRHVAHLTDRVAVGEGRPQVYGTQGRCRADGWRPDPIAEPEGVDARRAAVGLPPLAEQVREATARCR